MTLKRKKQTNKKRKTGTWDKPLVSEQFMTFLMKIDFYTGDLSYVNPDTLFM